MKAKASQYLNEIVSLSIMALMIAALVGAQTGAAATRAEPVVADPQVVVIDVDFSFRPQGE